MSHDQPLGIQLPTALATQSSAVDEAGVGEDAQMFCYRLARESGAPSQSYDGLGPAPGEAGHQLETGRVPQRCEERRGALEPGRLAIVRHGFRRR